VATSPPGIGKLCSDCASAEPETAAKKANAITPIHNLFILASVNEFASLISQTSFYSA
jgi:hypothetical protein